MKPLKALVLGLGLVIAGCAATPAVVSAASQPTPLDNSCGVQPENPICKSKDQKLFGPGSVWTNIVNTMIFVVGGVATLMIVIGGFRYTMSGGDAGSLKSAKDTILYAIIGVVVAAFAYTIVNFVLGRI